MPSDQEEQLKSILLGFIKDKPAALAQTSTSLLKLHKLQAGLDRHLELLVKYEDEPDKINFQKSAKAITITLIEMGKLLHQNTICLLMYMSVGDFDMNAAQLLTKLGSGGEAIKAFYESKLKGNDG